jgi:N-acetylgalactosamine-N,N'-diacetylbacillosaminyl-diphospho-undecaprenol 4-alpha-N-acetylgalactosaminyltransferase
MKKVAIFIYSLRGGGAERVVSYLLKEGYKNFEFHLILLRNEIEYEIPNTNVKIVKLGNSSSINYLSFFTISLQAKKLKKYLEDNKIDTLLSLLNRPNFISCKVKMLGWKGKLIISERTDTITHYKAKKLGWVMIKLVKKYYPFANKVIVISKGIANSLAKLGIPNAQLIYNPIYKSGASNLPASTKKEFTFINIARLEPEKNHALLLRAFANIKDKDCRLIILGNGVLLQHLEKMANTFGIADRVEFLGFHKDVKSYLNKSDCFVFTSNYEGFGNVIIEALQVGLPVISTDCPYGPREILSPESDTLFKICDEIEIAPFGILTPVGNVNHLSIAMQKIIDNPELRDRYKKIGESRANDFDVKIISKQYFDLFEE